MALDKKSSWSEITGYEHPPLLPSLRRNDSFEDLFEFLNFNIISPITPFLEYSKPLRWCVCICGLISLVTTFALIEFRISLLIHIIFLLIGNLYSYITLPQREIKSGGCAVKIFITIYMVWAFLIFLPSTFINSTYDIQADLATLLAGLLAGHSFDIPRRRDLDYSLLTSFILISYSSIISQSMIFSWAILAYLVSFLAALYFRSLSISESCSTKVSTAKNIQANISTSHTQQQINYLWVGKLAIRLVLSSILIISVSLLIYLAMPRFGGLVLYDIQHKFRLGFHFNFAKTVDENSASNDGEDSLEGNKIPRPKNSQNDINLDAAIDLRQRYDVNHELVMKVKSNAASYYRGVAFRHYDGWNWEVTNAPPRQIDGQNVKVPGIFVSDPQYIRHITQIYYVERDLPGVVFSSHLPYQISFPDQVLYADVDSTIKLNNIIDKDTIYTVKSFVFFNTPFNDLFYKSDLSKDGPLAYETQVFQQAQNEPKQKSHICTNSACYIPKKVRLPRWFDRRNQLLELPKCVTYRTKRLAHLLTHRYKNDYLKTMAIAHFLINNYTYEVRPPEYPSNVDTVDYFLFTSKKGNCEQFATSMAVLARAAGLRSRFIAGYTEGEYNPLTSMYEVYSDNAHAWTEVMVPGIGWLPVDATPHAEGPHNHHPMMTGKEHKTFII
ncbi:transglutaminase domain-containing protein, partial [bacterium]|nr:transglutaminase domain-containing protein [bacterium]